MTRKDIIDNWNIIEAIKDGKSIQFRLKHKDDDNWSDVENFSFSDACIYRIKPENTYRSFKTKEECLNEMKNHLPVGYIINNNNIILHIHRIDDIGIYTILINGKVNLYTWYEAFEHFTFVDHIPFGVKN